MYIIFLIAGLLVGVAAMWVYARGRRLDMERLHNQQSAFFTEQNRVQADELAALRTKLAESGSAREEIALRAVELQSENRVLQDKLDNQKNELQAAREQLNAEFRLMANEILEEKSKKFTELNRDNIDRILQPLQVKLGEFKVKVEETYDKESKERFSLDSRIRELVELNKRISEEANNLTRALKGDNKTQGDWGEMILESILERSGLVNGREYFTQETLTDENGQSLTSETGRRMRPDVVIAYPDNRKVIIDSKVSLTAYSRYVDTDDKELSAKALGEHLRSVKAHIDELAAKNYQDYTKALDFVMLFIPNEPAYLAVMQRDADLWQYAYAKRVLLISPTNLIAALKMIADLWKREYQNRNAIEIAERGAALYDKFAGFVESMGEIGTNLERTARSYNQAYNQLKEGRGNLISQVEKLKKLGVKARKELPKDSMEEDMDELPDSEKTKRINETEL